MYTESFYKLREIISGSHFANCLQLFVTKSVPIAITKKRQSRISFFEGYQAVLICYYIFLVLRLKANVRMVSPRHKAFPRA